MLTNFFIFLPKITELIIMTKYDKNGLIVLECNLNLKTKCFSIEEFKTDEIFIKMFGENIEKVLNELISNEDRIYPIGDLYNLKFVKKVDKQLFSSILQNHY